MKPFPFHFSFRSAAWLLAGLLTYDFFWFRVLLPAIMSSSNTSGIVAALIATVALIVLHIDVVWSLLTPATAEVRKVQCHFCDEVETSDGVPEDWSTFQHGEGSEIVSCGEPGCRVAMARSIASTLTFYTQDKQ